MAPVGRQEPRVSRQLGRTSCLRRTQNVRKQATGGRARARKEGCGGAIAKAVWQQAETIIRCDMRHLQRPWQAADCWQQIAHRSKQREPLDLDSAVPSLRQH